MNHAGRRTERTDGRYSLNLTVEAPDGTQRRIYFYGRTQTEAKAKAKAKVEAARGGAVGSRGPSVMPLAR